MTAAAAVTLLGGCAAPVPDAAWQPPAVVPTPAAEASSAPPSATPGPSPSATSVSPSTTSASPGVTPSGKPARPKPKPKATSAPRAGGEFVFPVVASRISYHPTHGKYPATDLFARCGSPVVAVTTGRVLEVSRKDRYVKGRPDGPHNGGLFVSVLGDDGVRYYGSHLSKVGAGIAAGVRVRAGQRLGLLGRTGNASNVCHLHFGLSPACAETGDWKVRRGVIWPKQFLDAWRRGRALSPAAKVAAWERSHNCKA